MDRRAAALRAAGLLVILAACIWLTVRHDLWATFTDHDRLVALIQANRSLSVAIFIGLQVLQVVIAFIPGELTGFIGGYLFGIGHGILYSTIGLSVGSLVAFWLARSFGRPLVLLVMKREHLLKFDYLMGRRGVLVSALLFILPGFPKDFLCYILGLTAMPTRVFVIIASFGRLLSTGLLTIAGDLVRHESYRAFIVLTVMTVAALFLCYLYRREIESALHRLSHRDDGRG